MTLLDTTPTPIRGPEYDRDRPESREAWLGFRRNGITATEVRDWAKGAKRRRIISEKVSGTSPDLSRVAAIAHGVAREVAISAWAKERFGIEPCSNVFASALNPRHLASPDGITMDPWTGEVVTGNDAVVLEVKTGVHDLMPGPLDEFRVVTSFPHDTVFWKYDYFVQMQWQMYVMGAAMTLFVWEGHTGQVDPEHPGAFMPTEPQWVWILRDDEVIADLIRNVDETMLPAIDAAITAAGQGDIPPVSPLDTRRALLVADLLAARDAEAIAVAAKKKAWDALTADYLAEGEPDVSVDAGFARITVSTSHGTKKVVQMDKARAKAPAVVAKYEALIARHTVNEPTTTRKLTVTSQDVAGDSPTK